MIKMVAFDFDGTIADSIPMCIQAFKKAISPYAGHKLTKHEILQTFGWSEIGMVKAVVKDNWKLTLQDFYFYGKYFGFIEEEVKGLCEKQSKISFDEISS